METTNLKEPQLTYAIDASGRMVSIESVENGLACNCICPKCKQPLIAKNEGRTRHKHFAHQGIYGETTSRTCHDSYITALHRLSEQIIRERKLIMAPDYEGVKEAHQISFTEVEVEERNDRTDLQPDLVGILENGYRCLIEIRNTSKISQLKKEKIINDGLICMEIDVRDMLLEDLEDFLLNSSERRTWVNNPEYERRRKKEISKSAKNTYINKSNTKTPLDVFFDKLKPNNDFVGSNGIKTSVINYGKTINGTKIVVLHGDNLTFKYYLTLVSFINGMPNFQLCGEFTNIEIAERELANLKSR